jgi:hypothetical protein
MAFRRTRLGSVLGATLVLFGCGVSPEFTTRPSPVATRSSPSSASASPTEAPTPPPTLPAFELTPGDDPLPPGRYTRGGFTPRSTVRLDRGWSAHRLTDELFSVVRNPARADFVVVEFVHVLEAYPDGEAAVPVATAADALAGIRDNAEVRVLEESPSRMSGLDGSNITVESRSNLRTGVLGTGGDGVLLYPGNRLWISVFDTAYGVVAIVVEGRMDNWERVLRLAEPLLESVTIGA